MAQILIRECYECGLGYYKPWYEPMWLGKKNWHQAHDAYHGNSQRDYGRQLERQRILELLKKHHKQTKAGNTNLARKYEAAVLACIALIEGDS
jgi:hypothetical protein